MKKDREGQRKEGGQNGWVKVLGPAKYVNLSYMQTIYFWMVFQMEIKESRFALHPALFTQQIITHLNKGTSMKD